MLAVYCADLARLRALEARIPAGWQVRPASDWNRLERSAAAAECWLVVVASPGQDPGARRLAALRERHPARRVVLALGDPGAAASGLAASADEVIPLGALERELPAALGRARVASRARSLPDAVRAAEHLPPRLREALARASNGGPPVRTVEKLAVLAGCDRRTLWNQWRHAFTDGELRLEDYLHWLLLLRATARKTPDRSWGDVAEEVGVHPHTLGRLARQLAGRSLRDLAAGGQAAVVERFDEAVLRHLQIDAAES